MKNLILGVPQNIICVRTQKTCVNMCNNIKRKCVKTKVEQSYTLRWDPPFPPRIKLYPPPPPQNVVFGKFSIIPPTNDVTLTQSSDKEINAGTDVRLVITLSEDMNKDIKLNKAIRIIIHSNLIHDAKTIVISSGSIK